MLELIGVLVQQGTFGLLAALCLLVAYQERRENRRLNDENRELTKQLVEGYRALSSDLAKLIDLNKEETCEDEKPQLKEGRRDNNNRG